MIRPPQAWYVGCQRRRTNTFAPTSPGFAPECCRSQQAHGRTCQSDAGCEGETFLQTVRKHPVPHTVLTTSQIYAEPPEAYMLHRLPTWQAHVDV